MRNCSRSTRESSTCRSDGIPEHVSVGKTRASLGAWKYPLAAALVLAAVIAGLLPWEAHAPSSASGSLQGHLQLVESVAFSPDGRTLASCGWDYTVRLWDMGRQAGAEPVEPVVLPHDTTRFVTAFSPDGATLVSVGDRSLSIWSCRPEYRRTLERVGESYHCAAFSPDGRTLALGAEDSSVRLWDMPSARERSVLRDHAGTIRSVAFSPDGRLLVSASHEGHVVLWDAISGAQVRVLLDVDTGPVGSVAFSPDGRTIGVGEFVYHARDVLLLDAHSGAVRGRLKGHRYGVHTLAFSPDGRYLATGGLDHSIKLWDLATSRALATLKEGVGWVKSIAFSPDGARIAFCGSDEVVRFWDVRVHQTPATGGGSAGELKEASPSEVSSGTPIAGSIRFRTYSSRRPRL